MIISHEHYWTSFYFLIPLSGVFVSMFFGCFLLLNMRGSSMKTMDWTTQSRIILAEMAFVLLLMFSLFYWDDYFLQNLNIVRQNPKFWIPIDHNGTYCQVLGVAYLITFFVIMGAHMEHAYYSLQIIRGNVAAANRPFYLRNLFFFTVVGILVGIIYSLPWKFMTKKTPVGYDALGVCGIERGNLLTAFYLGPPLIIFPYSIFCAINIRRLSANHPLRKEVAQGGNLITPRIFSVQKDNKLEYLAQALLVSRNPEIDSDQIRNKFSIKVVFRVSLNCIMWIPYTTLQVFMVLLPLMDQAKQKKYDLFADSSNTFINIKFGILCLTIYASAFNMIGRCVHPQITENLRVFLIKIGCYSIFFGRKANIEKDVKRSKLDHRLVTPCVGLKDESFEFKESKTNEMLRFGMLEGLSVAHVDVRQMILENMICFGCLQSLQKNSNGRFLSCPPRKHLLDASLDIRIHSFHFDLEEVFETMAGSKNFEKCISRLLLDSPSEIELEKISTRESCRISDSVSVRKSLEAVYNQTYKDWEFGKSENEFVLVEYYRELFADLASQMLPDLNESPLNECLSNYFSCNSVPFEQESMLNNVSAIYAHESEFYLLRIKMEIKKLLCYDLIPSYYSHIKASGYRTFLQPILGMYSAQVECQRAVSSILLQKSGDSQTDFVIVVLPAEIFRFVFENGSFVRESLDPRMVSLDSATSLDSSEVNLTCKFASGTRSAVISTLVKDLNFLEKLGLTGYFICLSYSKRNQFEMQKLPENSHLNSAGTHVIRMSIMNFIQNELVDIAKSGEYFSENNPNIYRERLFTKICTRFF